MNVVNVLIKASSERWRNMAQMSQLTIQPKKDGDIPDSEKKYSCILAPSSHSAPAPVGQNTNQNREIIGAKKGMCRRNIGLAILILHFKPNIDINNQSNQTRSISSGEGLTG